MTKQERKKETRAILEKIDEISTVEDIFWWKNLSNRFSVENINKEKIRKLKWENSDVLYSFLGDYKKVIDRDENNRVCEIVSGDK